jgi:hypothetical protein
MGSSNSGFPEALKAYATVEMTEKLEQSYQCAYWKVKEFAIRSRGTPTPFLNEPLEPHTLNSSTLV